MSHLKLVYMRGRARAANAKRAGVTKDSTKGIMPAHLKVDGTGMPHQVCTYLEDQNITFDMWVLRSGLKKINLSSRATEHLFDKLNNML